MHYLGIDGGGSHTRALLCDASGRTIGKGLSGPTNPRSTPAATLKANLLDAIQQACSQASPSTIRAAHLGIAGCGDPRMHTTLTAIARQCITTDETQISIGHDLEIVVEGSLVGQPGIVLLAGTGSACYGRDAQDRTAECGGWGDLVDDAGSGSWIGLLALQAAVRQADGRQSKGPLMHKVMEFLQISTMHDFKTRIHQQGLPRNERAGLAPVVITLAESGDRAATQILSQASEELCALAVSTSQQLQLSAPRILLAGGLTENRFFYETLSKSLPAHIAGARPSRPQLNAASGAVLLALRSAKVPIDQNIINSLKKTALIN